MKKIIAALALLCVFAVGVFGQMINTIQYAETFGFRNGQISHTSEYVMSATRADRRNFADLAGNEVQIDTPLEFALLSYYSQPVITMRPVEADEILPANNPRQADLKLGAAVFQEIQILCFLGNTAAEGRHRGILKFITDRRNVTEAEVEAYYRNNIRGLVSQIVDEEFGKAGQDGIVPAQVYADWERQGIVRVNGKAVNGIELIKQVLGDFFLNPTETNYIRVRGIIARILAGTGSPFLYAFDSAWANVITSISPELHSKLRSEFPRVENTYTHARQPNDPAFRIFEIPYAVGGR
jgi:hypothetical protein